MEKVGVNSNHWKNSAKVNSNDTVDMNHSSHNNMTIYEPLASTSENLANSGRCRRREISQNFHRGINLTYCKPRLFSVEAVLADEVKAIWRAVCRTSVHGRSYSHVRPKFSAKSLAQKRLPFAGLAQRPKCHLLGYDRGSAVIVKSCHVGLAVIPSLHEIDVS